MANIEAMELWVAVSTQWRVGMALVGLDYNAVFLMAENMQIDLSPCMWNKIRAMEAHVLKESRNHDGRDGKGFGQAEKKPQD